MRRLLTLNKVGQLALRSSDGAETEVATARPHALLLIDTSGSMAGPKLERAKLGATEFAQSAIGRGYTTSLAVFADRAAMVCDPTYDAAVFTAKMSGLRVGVVGATTDLAAGLILANKFHQLAAVVVVTDGATTQAPRYVLGTF